VGGSQYAIPVGVLDGVPDVSLEISRVEGSRVCDPIHAYIDVVFDVQRKLGVEVDARYQLFEVVLKGVADRHLIR
jgi:hypothetical protein